MKEFFVKGLKVCVVRNRVVEGKKVETNVNGVVIRSDAKAVVIETVEENPPSHVLIPYERIVCASFVPTVKKDKHVEVGTMGVRD